MNYIYHHGIKGMKWGVRRFQNKDGSLTSAGKKKYSGVDTIKSKKTGENLHVAKKQNRFGDGEDYFDVIRSGKRVGRLIIEDQGDNLYLNWIDIKKTERGKGYADSIMDYVVKYADKKGYKTMTLEVPGSSPDARHIYEKHGFKVENTQNTNVDDVWGGLTNMKKKLR